MWVREDRSWLKQWAQPSVCLEQKMREVIFKAVPGWVPSCFWRPVLVLHWVLDSGHKGILQHTFPSAASATVVFVAVQSLHWFQKTAAYLFEHNQPVSALTRRCPEALP